MSFDDFRDTRDVCDGHASFDASHVCDARSGGVGLCSGVEVGSVDALLAADPFVLTSAQRRDALLAVQAASARLAAVQGALLVAECGLAPRVRQVEVQVRQGAGERESVAAADGAQIAQATSTVTGLGMRTVSFTDEAVDELAALLHRTHGSVVYELRRARLLHGPLAPVGAALAAGSITAAHTAGICEQAARMLPDGYVFTALTDSDLYGRASSAVVDNGTDPSNTDPSATSVVDTTVAGAHDPVALVLEHVEFEAKCARLAERVLPVAVRSTPGATRSHARRLVAQIDAAAERERRRRAKARMDVVAVAEDDGLASVIATMSAIDAATLIARVDAHAKTTMASHAPLLSDPHASLGQHRVAAYLHLLGMRPRTCATEPLASLARPAASALPAVESAGPAPRPTPATRVEVQVLVDARVLAGVAEGSGWVQVGSGDATPIDRDDIITLLADEATPAVLRRLLIDPTSGALVDRGASTYTPNTDLVAWLATRDVTCRFPSCTAKAARCDIDHATDFEAGGLTTVANTGLLCRRHHNRKTHAGWTITDTSPDGSCEFISPHGQRHRHFPTPLTDLMTEARPPNASSLPSRRPEPDDDPPPF